MTAGWRLDRGASVLPDGSVRFSLWAPRAKQISVRILGGSRAREHRLDRGRDGVHSATVPGVRPGARYVFRLDGARDRPDPVSRSQPEGVHGPSRVVDPRAFRWTDGGWKGRRTAELIIYELHVGTFTEKGTFDAAVEALPWLRALGVTAIELMPVAEFPGARNWGYDGAHPYAPQSTYGGPEGLRRLVDAAHAAGISVILDVVHNHLGPEGNYLAGVGPYFTRRYRNPWGAAINFDGPGSREVRRYFTDNALYWIDEYHLDGLRLDAVQGIRDGTAPHILEEIARATKAHAARLGRHVAIIAESDRNEPRLVRARGKGGYGLDAQWNDDFVRAVHGALAGPRGRPEAGRLRALAEAFRHPFAPEGRFPQGRRPAAPKSRALSGAEVAAHCFIVCVQNHDQVGNRSRGERLAALVPFARQKLAAAMLFLSPFVPLLFMGEEYGETNPFHFFVSHSDATLIESVRRGRRAEWRAYFGRGKMPDPGDEETFLRSRPQRRIDTPRRKALLALYRDLIRLRRRVALLRPGAGAAAVSEAAEGWIALRTTRGEAALFTCFNLSDGPIEATMPAEGRGALRLFLWTGAARYGDEAGIEDAPRAAVGGEGVRMRLGPLSAAAWIREGSMGTAGRR